MYKIKILFILVSSLLAINTYQIDENKSTIYWVGEKLTGSHNGEIDLYKGEIQVNRRNVIGGDLIVDMKTIKNLDIESEKYRGYLEEHLKSEDFFHVNNFPFSTITILDVLPPEDSSIDTSIFICNLTIKGITHQIHIPVKFSILHNSAVAYGTVNVDRSLYDIKYKSLSFFPNIGDKLIYDNFIITFNIVATRVW